MAAAVRALAAALAQATTVALAAGSVADPTQPPTAQQPRTAAAPDGPARDSRLQMVIRGPGENRTALIGGQSVRVGDRIELDGSTARVAAIFDDRVVLQQGTQRETLELLPTIPAPATAPPAVPTASRTAPPSSR